MLTLKIFYTLLFVSIFNFEQVSAGLVITSENRDSFRGCRKETLTWKQETKRWTSHVSDIKDGDQLVKASHVNLNYSR